MNFYTVELPCGTVTAMVDDLAVADVHSSNGFHFPICQHKIEDVKAFLHVAEISLLTLYFYKIPFFSLLCARSLSIRKNTHKLPLSHL